MHPLFEMLSSKNYIKRNKLNVSFIYRQKINSILDSIEELSRLTLTNHINTTKSSFSHTASANYGGARSGCFCYDCRQNRLLELAHFTSLYCDKVYIHNFFSDYSDQYGRFILPEEEELKYDFIDDIKLLLSIKPLVDSEIIVPFTDDLCLCPACLANTAFQKESTQIQKITRMLKLDLCDNVKIKLSKIGDNYYSDYYSSQKIYDPNSLYLFEVFCSMKLGTCFNEYQTH